MSEFWQVFWGVFLGTIAGKVFWPVVKGFYDGLAGK